MRFDYEETFGDDYLYFYGPHLTDERNRQDADAIVSFLGLKPGDVILDAPCGHGRISALLAERGMQVVGVDASERFLEIARGQSPQIEYLMGDLRRLPVDGPFDAAVSWFTSFGYFDDDDNMEVLRQYRRVLRPGGRLLIETQNHDHFVRNFRPGPASMVNQIGDDFMIDTTDFDCETGRIETDRVVVRDGDTRRSHHSIRVPTVPEFRSWLTAAGFTSVVAFARDGEAASIARPRLVVIAEV